MLFFFLYSGCVQQKISDSAHVISQPESADTGAEPSDDSAEVSDPTAEPDVSDSGSGCVIEAEPALQWFSQEQESPLLGSVSFGQTHVIDENEQRLAPLLITHRAMALFFTPEEPLDFQSSVRMSAWKEGELLGVVALNAPEKSMSILEATITEEPLEPWSEEAWSVAVPYSWVEAGVEYKIGVVQEENLYVRYVVLGSLAAPHQFNIFRSKMVLFGEEGFDTSTIAASTLSRDYFATIPAAQLRWVDSTDWVVDDIVVQGANGPVLVSSEAERLALTTDPDRWNILKHIFTFRVNLAHIGLGTQNTSFVGQNSVFSTGTSVGLGWVKNETGQYVDINNAPYSAGWTGWTAIWHGECGNVFTHEVGHSLTLAHFTEGSAQNWGIEHEYPEDGVHLSSHPWGFDTTRMMFRTWYRVDLNGIVYKTDGSIQGKRDPMNGGESSNAASCFPQYTAYHARKAQQWMNEEPTVREENGVLGYYLWNHEQQQYEATGDFDWLPIETNDVPVMTVIGSLGAAENVSHLYPPMFWAQAPVFTLPSPQESGWTMFEGGAYFVRIEFSDATTQDVLINREQILDSAFALFSFNIPMVKQPTSMQLFLSDTVYPNMNLHQPTLLHERSIDIPSEFPAVILSGLGSLSNGVLSLFQRCEMGINCAERAQESMWRSNSQLSCTYGEMELLECTQEEEVTDFSIVLHNEEGESHEVLVQAQRIVRTDTQEFAVAMNDSLTWSERVSQEQGVRVWIPWEENAEIPAGHWSSQGEVLFVWKDGVLWKELPLHIELEILESETVDLTTNEYTSPSLMPVPNYPSSLYFVATDPQVGPTSGVWWGGYEPTILSVPVVSQTGRDILYVRAWRQTCNQGWGTQWQLNSAQVADETCTYQIRLVVEATDNLHLVSGSSYQTSHSEALVLEGRYWHAPVSHSLAGRFSLNLLYTHP